MCGILCTIHIKSDSLIFDDVRSKSCYEILLHLMCYSNYKIVITIIINIYYNFGIIMKNSKNYKIQYNQV